MTALWRIFRKIFQDQRGSLIRGAAFSLVVLVMGVSLLGLSGWFITAVSAVGLAGMGPVLGLIIEVLDQICAVKFGAVLAWKCRIGQNIVFAGVHEVGELEPT